MRVPALFCAVMFVAAGCSSSKPGAGSGGSTASNAATGSGGTSATSGTTAATTSTTSGTTSAGSTGTTGATCPSGLTGLAISPTTANQTISNGAATPITFTLQPSGAASIDPSLVTWTATRADDTNPGTVVNGVFTPYSGAGGVVTITAAGCGQSASAQVTLSLQTSAVVATDGGAADPGAFTGAVVTGDATHAPSIVYPSAETRFPRNIYKVLFQWKKGTGNTQFRLTFTGPGSTVQVYTDGSHPSCAAVANLGCWEADAATWDAIAGSNAGATVQLQIDGIASAGSSIYASTSETLGFSRRDVKGAIFYWAADVGGIQRATVSDAAPENYLVGPLKVPATVLPNGDSVSCAACHTVSRDGKKMAVTGSATGPVAMPKGLWSLDVTPTPPPAPIQTSYPSATGDGFASFSPDTSKLVWSPRNGGTLELLDTATGVTVTAVSIGGQNVAGIAPDWSPRTDRDEIAYADTTGKIARVTWDGTTFAGPATLAPLIGGKKNAYPSYSPEGDWVAFTNNNKSLYLVVADGGAPVELAAANRVVNNATVAPSENSMPTWAPPGDLHWVAFNSQRAYGLVSNGGNNQLWVAAVDFSRLDGGVDPSYPAFRLPFQDINAKNHRAFWTLDVREADGGAFDAGPAVDAGTYVYDAGACVNDGDPCDPNGGAACCGLASSGSYCAPNDAGADVCQVPIFK